MSTCHTVVKNDFESTNAWKRTIEKFECNLRWWIAAVIASQWMPSSLIEEGIDQRGLCFPLGLLEVDRKGETHIIEIFNLFFNFRNDMESG